jgi:hypothetical protein
MSVAAGRLRVSLFCRSTIRFIVLSSNSTFAETSGHFEEPVALRFIEPSGILRLALDERDLFLQDGVCRQKITFTIKKCGGSPPPRGSHAAIFGKNRCLFSFRAFAARQEHIASQRKDLRGIDFE